MSHPILKDQLLSLDDQALAATLSCLAETCKEISQQLKRGELAGILGAAGNENVQGEEQKKLDVIANDLIKDALGACEPVRGIASEEEDDVVGLRESAGLLVTFDPLDGSSNIDINSMVGTIFSILPGDATGPVSEAEFLQPGRKQVAAGYVLYGPSTMLSLTTGDGVEMYTLDPESGDFLLTREASIPAQTKEFAINMSNQRFWTPAVQDYIAELLQGKDGPRGKNYNMRWVAAMVADVHRVLCRGGVFMYPWDARDPNKPGKLRLMCEATPMGFLVEQAGGQCCTPEGPILDLQPDKIHQRVPVILGAAEEVSRCLSMHAQAAA